MQTIRITITSEKPAAVEITERKPEKAAQKKLDRLWKSLCKGKEQGGEAKCI